MPTISIFFGIVIQMYWRDHNPPHIHAIYQGQEGLFSIETGKAIKGNCLAGRKIWFSNGLPIIAPS